MAGKHLWGVGEWDKLTRGDDAGCYTSVLSGVGVVIRHAVYPLATGGEGQLVSSKI